MEAIDTALKAPARSPRELPLPLGRLILVMLPFSLFVSTMLTVVDLWSTEDRNSWLAASLFLLIAMMSLSIHAALTGSLSKSGKRNLFALRATGSVGLVFLLPLIAAVLLTLGVSAPRRLIALIGLICVLVPVAFAFAGPWVARQVVPEGPATGGTFWGRLWRIALLGPLPLVAVVALAVLLRGGDVPLISGYWSGAVVDTLSSTVSNLTIIIYAWAITRTARTNTAEVFA